MKPTLETARTNKRGDTNRLPITDYNYHSVALDEFHGRCANVCSPSFLNISRDYFETEARRSFIGEAVFFALIIITAAYRS